MPRFKPGLGLIRLLLLIPTVTSLNLHRPPPTLWFSIVCTTDHCILCFSCQQNNILPIPTLESFMLCTLTFNVWNSVFGHLFIGELAPLLSTLGHKMHKRHKSAGIFWPNLDAVLLCSVSFSPLPLNLYILSPEWRGPFKVFTLIHTCCIERSDSWSISSALLNASILWNDLDST
jgi:hypothetical protein